MNLWQKIATWIKNLFNRSAAGAALPAASPSTSANQVGPSPVSGPTASPVSNPAKPPLPVPPLNSLRANALTRWEHAVIRQGDAQLVDAVAKKILSFKAEFYDPASARSGVPWYVIGALDYRESDFDHSSYLGNGDPIDRPTVHVPAGRGPFSSWAMGAADALTLDNWNKLAPGTTWSIDTILLACEEWNGLGYRDRGLPSPYVWALTNQQQAGKFIGDGEFSPTTWDSQIGCAAIFLSLQSMGVKIG